MATHSVELTDSGGDPAAREGSHSKGLRDRGVTAVYLLGLGVSISLWFLAIRAPLWLDETGSYWQISDGFAKIWPRQIETIAFPSYSYILWLSTKVFGTSEIALRVPSIVAMLGAVYLLYLAARKLFERNLAILVTTLFCLSFVVRFEAIDIRPYACAALAINATILLLLQLRDNDSNWLSASIGVLTAVVISFQFLFAVFVPAVAICFFAVKDGRRKVVWRQLGVAAAAFLLAFIPLISGVASLFRTRETHVYEAAPTVFELIRTLGSDWTLAAGGVVLFIALLMASWHRPSPPDERRTWRIGVCLALGLVPLFILYAVSRWTPVHMFAARHRLVAIPGISLLWGLILERWLAGSLRLLVGTLVVAVTMGICLWSPHAKQHFFTWKYALEAVERNASVDNSPVLVCSDFIEADYADMSTVDAKDSKLFAPLSYYRLTVPVVPMPQRLNNSAIREATQFLAQATPRHERFLAMASPESSKTLDWLARQTATSYDVNRLGIFDRVAVWEFRPKR